MSGNLRWVRSLSLLAILVTWGYGWTEDGWAGTPSDPCETQFCQVVETECRWTGWCVSGDPFGMCDPSQLPFACGACGPYEPKCSESAFDCDEEEDMDLVTCYLFEP